jgi:hypothetical protein
MQLFKTSTQTIAPAVPRNAPGDSLESRSNENQFRFCAIIFQVLVDDRNAVTPKERRME